MRVLRRRVVVRRRGVRRRGSEGEFDLSSMMIGMGVKDIRFFSGLSFIRSSLISI